MRRETRSSLVSAADDGCGETYHPTGHPSGHLTGHPTGMSTAMRLSGTARGQVRAIELDGADRGWLADQGDWRTLCLIGLVYALFGGILLGGGIWLEQVGGPILFAAVTAPLLTLYCSLQHEVIHGHPFRAQRVNDLLVYLPLALIIPYSRFKQTHLRHHVDPNLCDPYDDPESWYLDRGTFERLPRIFRFILRINNTFCGRLLIGPVIGTIGFFGADMSRAVRGEWRLAIDWAMHLILAAVVLMVVSTVGGISPFAYGMAAYLSMSLLMVRTFAEHQCETAPGGGVQKRGKSIIVENGGIFAFLFLNNSLHAVHHALPRLAWYRLPARYRAQTERFDGMNRDYRVNGYGELLRRFAFRQKEPVPHPDRDNRR